MIEQNAARQWQPIETAPKDGQKLILFNAGGIGVGSWRYGRFQIWQNGLTPSGMRVAIPLDAEGFHWEWDGHNQPTHWMPLPEPPK